MMVSGASAIEDGKRHSEDVLASVVDSLREAVLVVDASMRIVRSNAAAMAAFSRRGEPLEGSRLSEAVRDALLHQAYRDAFSTNGTVDVRVEIAAVEEQIYDVRVAPIEVDGERWATGIFYDVSQIERLEKVRQEFLSNISHELRTPLTSILAFVETLEDGALDDPDHNRHFLGVIRRNAERMRLLVSDILELSLIESGRVSLDPADVRLKTHVDGIFAALSAQAATRDIRLINEIDENASVRADPGRLEQMLTNLVDNAIKFNRQGGAVTVGHCRADGRDLITVTDEGEGILPAQLGRIFERFYRADRARTSGVGGTGLGLAIVKHLARLHGGEISAASDLGRGSRFTIEIPAD
jgi:two-component system phosphate regulon sensor histidine kinase PhoR